METILDPGAYDPELACFLSLRHATGGHEQKPWGRGCHGIFMQVQGFRGRFSILATEESDENTEKGLSVFAG